LPPKHQKIYDPNCFFCLKINVKSKIKNIPCSCFQHIKQWVVATAKSQASDQPQGKIKNVKSKIKNIPFFLHASCKTVGGRHRKKPSFSPTT